MDNYEACFMHITHGMVHNLSQVMVVLDLSPPMYEQITDSYLRRNGDLVSPVFNRWEFTILGPCGRPARYAEHEESG